MNLALGNRKNEWGKGKETEPDKKKGKIHRGCKMSACCASDLQVINPVLVLILFVRQKASHVREFNFILSFISRGIHFGICVLP